MGSGSNSLLAEISRCTCQTGGTPARRPAGRPSYASAHAEGDSLDQLPAETVLQAIEDLFATITHHLGEPDAAVDGDKKGAFVDARGFGMGGEGGIDELAPDAQDLGFALSFVHPELREDRRQQLARSTRRVLGGGFEGDQI